MIIFQLERALQNAIFIPMLGQFLGDLVSLGGKIYVNVLIQSAWIIALRTLL